MTILKNMSYFDFIFRRRCYNYFIASKIILTLWLSIIVSFNPTSSIKVSFVFKLIITSD
jgi:hypothetical protein